MQLFREHIEAQNYRITRAGWDLWRSSSPTPLKQFPDSRLLGYRKASKHVLHISKEGDSTTSLFQFSITLNVKKFFLMFRWIFFCSSLLPLPCALSQSTLPEKSLTLSTGYPFFRYV